MKDWEKEFDIKFPYLGTTTVDGYRYELTEKVKTFIRSLLSQSRFQTIAEIREGLKDKKHTMAHIVGAKRVEQDYIFLSDLLSILERIENEKE